MDKKVPVTEERISQSIHLCFPANISEPDSSISDEQPLPKVSFPSISSIFPATISESDSSSVLSGERLPQSYPSIHSIFPPTTSQTSSPANHEKIPYIDPIESCFPPRCSDYSDSDTLVRYDINIINRYLRSFSIQSLFPPRRSSASVTSIDSDSSFNFESYPNGQILETHNLKEYTFADLRTATSNYDVFLSFRGEDMRHCFISHLYSALCHKKIQTFIDDNELERGEEISPALLKTIEDSKLSVIIFSKYYTSSKWCLDELVKIIECKNTRGQIVVPVFYGVKPSDVRKQSGSFEVAFAKHEEDFKEKNMEKVQRWRAAVTEAANLSGWEWEATKPKSTLVDEIVTFVLKKLNHMSSSEFEGLVGINSWIDRLNSLPCILGLWGIGGIGKTTIAGAFFNRYSSQFEACCFIPNVREQSEKWGLDHLRNELLFKILGDKNLHIGTPHIGSTFIKDWVNRKKLLIVFDDVTTLSQLETLVGGPDIRVGSLGSRIIITSRDRQVLKNCEVDYIQEIEGLKKDEALQLLGQYAFKQNHPTKYHLELSEKAVSYAKGNPLALKVLYSSLFGKSDQQWKSKLGALEGTFDKEIEQVLKISYDGLEVDQKDIFLYIACFFKEKDRDYVTKILDGCGFSVEDGISVLIEKALITCKYNILSMHDLLQGLGRHIVREESFTEPGKRRMLWNHEDIYHVLKENTGSETVEGISLDVSKIRDLHLHPEAFARMYNLKLLKFYGNMPRHVGRSKEILLPRGLKSLPNQLRSLCWHGYPLKSLPSKFYPEKLVELDLSYSRVEKLWTGVQPLLVNLKIINLSYSQHLKEMPDLSRTPNVESINLEGCCKIRSLASNIHLESLRYLYLDGCSNLKKFPEVSWNITELYLGMTAIEELPPSIEFFRGLTTLSFENCKRLKNLPNNIFNLESLDKLVLSGCPNITAFPNISGKISCLDLSGTAIEKVPSSIESLSQLYRLDLKNCRKLKSLPTSICKLKSLDKLYLSGCSKLENFPEILEPTKGFKHLHLSNCSNLTDLPENLGNLKLLEELQANGVGIKQFPESICCLSSLRRLSLCENTFEKIPASIKQLSRLESLKLCSCKRLQSLPELPSTLLELDANDCTSLETVSSNEVDMHRLQVLRFSTCNKLDQDVRNKIVAAAQLRFQNIPHKFSFCYPGSEFPEWFSYQCVGSSLTVSSGNKFVRSIIVGANIGFDDGYHEHDNSRLSFHLQYYIKCNDGRVRLPSSYFELGNLVSDNMFLLCNDYLHRNITEVSLEIRPVDDDDKHKKTSRKLKVKKLGVALSYAQYDDNHYSTEKEDDDDDDGDDHYIL